MKLWLLRHGEAEAQADRDQNRRLTQYGQDQVRAVSAKLAQQRLGRILVSPYVRAQETAHIVQDALKHDVQMTTVSWLTPDTPVDETFSHLEAPDSGDLLLIAHQPLLGTLCSLLVYGSTDRAFPLSTAALVELEAELVLAGSMALRAIH
ncbi:phosphohistidine phosphatase SixA [Pseudomonas sp. Marseille-QA0892]